MDEYTHAREAGQRMEIAAMTTLTNEERAAGMTPGAHGNPTMALAAFMNAGCPDDLWGILNWARDSNRSVWDACPQARPAMIESAAFRRWEANYPHTNAAYWLAFARWLTVTLGEIGWENMARVAT